MRSNLALSMRAAKVAACSLLAYSLLLSAQTQRTPAGSNSDFNVGAPKDDILGNTKSGNAKTGIQSQVDSPNRTVGPQRDGSIVVSDNQV